MSDLVDHAPHVRRVLQHHAMADAPQTETLHHGRLIVLEPNRALDERHLHSGAFGIRSMVRHKTDPITQFTSRRTPRVPFLGAALSMSDPSGRRARRSSRAPRCAGSPNQSTSSGYW